MAEMNLAGVHFCTRLENDNAHYNLPKELRQLKEKGGEGDYLVFQAYNMPGTYHLYFLLDPDCPRALSVYYPDPLEFSQIEETSSAQFCYAIDMADPDEGLEDEYQERKTELNESARLILYRQEFYYKLLASAKAFYKFDAALEQVDCHAPRHVVIAQEKRIFRSFKELIRDYELDIKTGPSTFTKFRLNQYPQVTSLSRYIPLLANNSEFDSSLFISTNRFQKSVVMHDTPFDRVHGRKEWTVPQSFWYFRNQGIPQEERGKLPRNR